MINKKYLRIALALSFLFLMASVANFVKNGQAFDESLFADCHQIHTTINNSTMRLFMADIKIGSYDCIKEQLNKVDTVIMYNNEGGTLFEAMRIANHIQRNDIKIISNGNCFSSCSLILFASREATTTQLSRVGSHQTNLEGKIGFGLVNSAIKKIKQRIIKGSGRAVNFDYYNKIIKKTPFDNLYIHSKEDLIKNGMIKEDIFLNQQIK